MPLFMVKNACGHEQIRRLPENAQDANTKKAWHESRLCRACWKKKAIEDAEKRMLTGIMDELPNITGTPDQVLWATNMRQDALRAADNQVSNTEPEQGKIFWFIATMARRRLLCETSAKWWIDNRGEKLNKYVKAAIDHAKSL
jgi:hypothetical protein